MANWKWINKVMGKEEEQYIDEDNGMEYADEGYEEQPQTTRQAPRTEAPRQTGSISGGDSSLAVKIFKPKEFSEVPSFAHHVLEDRTLVLNLEAMNKEDIKRVLDYFGGVTLAINGKIKRASNFTYIISPRHVDVSAETENTQRAQNELFN